MDATFEKLEALRLLAKEILADQRESLKQYGVGAGFCHVLSKKKDTPSVSSTCTCVLSFVATRSWAWWADKAKTKDLLRYMVAQNESADLEKDNPFTTAWILDAAIALKNGYADPLEDADNAEISRKEGVLLEKLTPRGVSIAPYPSSAYLTHLVVRVLKNPKSNGLLPKDKADQVNEWAWAELTRQLALIQAKSKTGDPFAVLYLLLIVTSLTPSSDFNPERSSIRRLALRAFFECQLPDGTWPLSRPLFIYPTIGNAHCYEYEALTQLLQQSDLSELLFEYLPNIELAARSAYANAYRLGTKVRAWSSGHHPQVSEPESWTTASVYHFFFVLDRLLSGWVRRELYRYLDLTPASAPTEAKHEKLKFATDMLDSTVFVDGRDKSLKDFLWEEFVSKISAESDFVASGSTFEKQSPRSAILFGPPGTSKTDLATKTADFLGWPFLPIDPSMLLKNGMEGIQAEANAIFRMLAQTDSIVVLFDEFDELVRERGSSRAEQPFSRLLTTAMLPKLAELHRRANLVFIIATNNIAEFDLAISREGRFDRVVQVLPPTYAAKTAFKNWGLNKNLDFKACFQGLGLVLDEDEDLKRKIGDLTYGETQALASELATASKLQDALKALNDRWNKCTLQRHVPKLHARTEEEISWRERCDSEKAFNR
jgi:hypothetical protein